MSYRRESYSIIRIGLLLQGTIKTDQVPMLYLNQNFPVKNIKFYGIITDKTLDEGTGSSGYLFRIDDGTGSIWAKYTGNTAENLKKWDFVRIIGYIEFDTSNGRDYEIIVSAESITLVPDKNWELVHVLESKHNKDNSPNKELNKTTSINNQNQESSDLNNSDSTISDNDPNDNQISEMGTLAEKVEKILRENDSGDGVDLPTIMKLVGVAEEVEIEDILFELAYEGKVFQPRPDYYKLLD